MEELEKAIEAGKETEIQEKTATIDATVKQAEKDIEKTVSGSKIETLLMR